MERLATGVGFVDLNFQGTPGAVATAVCYGSSGVTLVDPGPSSTWPTLEAALGASGIALSDVTSLVLTHVHLDHAGVTGSLVRQRPSLEVFVHERGATHLVDPGKLVASAARLWGDRMHALWGEVAPVPPSAIRALLGGERLVASGRVLESAYTPGHASHHLAYWCADLGIAFAGDIAGIKLASSRQSCAAGASHLVSNTSHAAPGTSHPVLRAPIALPPTPPPDIDLVLWGTSLDRVAAWRPDTLFLTHFGPHGTPDAHIAELRDSLAHMERIAAASLARDEPDEARAGWFANEIRRQLRSCVDEAGVDAYEAVGGLELSWLGLARYLRKRAAA